MFQLLIQTAQQDQIQLREPVKDPHLELEPCCGTIGTRLDEVIHWTVSLWVVDVESAEEWEFQNI